MELVGHAVRYQPDNRRSKLIVIQFHCTNGEDFEFFIRDLTKRPPMDLRLRCHIERRPNPYFDRKVSPTEPAWDNFLQRWEIF